MEKLMTKSSALTEGYVGALHENRHGSAVQIRRRKASGDPYWAYSELFDAQKYMENVLKLIKEECLKLNKLDSLSHNSQGVAIWDLGMRAKQTILKEPKERAPKQIPTFKDGQVFARTHTGLEHGGLRQ
ncbi:hypothetical protein P7K49_030905 [Saguinus oedipus]|uniref:Uncharacterized protein n=1 Tax=Saguinus oedipus TaxID=9490 RepID=A0ABQ9U3I0_SAGOE|nr:hypothetical protein P7K49_030905 [Saguinus oedipus]